MQTVNLGTIERKLLGALLVLADESMMVTATLKEIANIMGYKNPGGAITMALTILERDNFIVKEGKGRYKLIV